MPPETRTPAIRAGPESGGRPSSGRGYTWAWGASFSRKWPGPEDRGDDHPRHCGPLRRHALAPPPAVRLPHFGRGRPGREM